MDLLGVTGVLESVDLVIVGEGSLGSQSRRGKATLVLADRALRRGIPVVAVAGQVSLPDSHLGDHGIVRAWSLTELAGGRDAAVRDVRILLREVGRQIAAWWAWGR
jgi:glycerate kinase